MGFTLIETVVVLLLLSVLMSFALLDLGRASRRSNLTAAARQLAAELRLARIRAITLNNNYRILLQAGVGGYSRQARGSSGYREDGPTLALPDGIVTVSCSSPSGGISFRPRGVAAEFGTVTLANADNERRKVIVNFTGEVRIE